MRVGIFGDLHFPFCHPMYLRFCEDTFDAWGVNKLVAIGDVADQHALSFWEHDPNGMSAESERRDAQGDVDEMRRRFNRLFACIGNHDERHYRVARKAGLPEHYLRGYAEVWNTPQWQWDYDHTIDGVEYTHGTGTSGKDAALNLAQQKRNSTVIGHVHCYGGVKWHANNSSIIFGLNVGCGIDCKAYAFSYGKAFPIRPTLGCGIVIDGEFAIFEPMRIGRGEKYHRSKAGKKKHK